MTAEWRVPPVWNAFERNRARAYAVAFNLMVTVENWVRAQDLRKRGENRVATPFEIPKKGHHIGVGFWGAGRGFLIHHCEIKDGLLANYQIVTPSTVNACPRTPWGEPGPYEQAVLNTPIVESKFADEDDFQGIDILRTHPLVRPLHAVHDARDGRGQRPRRHARGDDLRLRGSLNGSDPGGTETCVGLPGPRISPPTVLIGIVGFTPVLDSYPLGPKLMSALEARLADHVGVIIENMTWSPIHVVQRFQDEGAIRPDRLVLVGAAATCNCPGTVRAVRWIGGRLPGCCHAGPHLRGRDRCRRHREHARHRGPFRGLAGRRLQRSRSTFPPTPSAAW